MWASPAQAIDVSATAFYSEDMISTAGSDEGAQARAIEAEERMHELAERLTRLRAGESITAADVQQAQDREEDSRRHAIRGHERAAEAHRHAADAHRAAAQLAEQLGHSHRAQEHRTAAQVDATAADVDDAAAAADAEAADADAS